jgi:HK97 family phage major capsid protein
MDKYYKLAAALLDQADAIQVSAETEDRDLSDEEVESINSLVERSNAAKAKGDSLKALADNRAALESTPVRTPIAGATSVIPAQTAPAVEEDPKRGFASFGDFASSVVKAYDPTHRAVDDRLVIGAAAQGLNQTVGADGGFDVPPEFNTTIWDGLNEQPDNLLAETDQYVLQNTESLTLNANAETSRANGSRYGGILGTWLAAEADQIPLSNPQIRQIKIEPNEFAVLVPITDKLLRNGTAMEQYLTRASIDEINFSTSDAVFNGSGAGQPLGLVGHAGTVEVATTTTLAEGITYADIRNIYSRCHARARRGAKWYINQDLEPALMGMKDDNGNAVYLPAGNLSGAPFATLLGKPVVEVEYCQTSGTAGDIIFANLDYYATALRSYGVQSAVSMHLRFDFAETMFRFIFEVDGRPWLDAPLTPKNGVNTLSPFVQLATRV